MIHLPSGPTAYFKLTSVQLTKEIYVCFRVATIHGGTLDELFVHIRDMQERARIILSLY